MLKRNDEYICRKVNNTFYIIDDKNLYRINEVMARILSLCCGDENSNSEFITAKLSEYYNMNKNDIKDDVIHAVKQLINEKIIFEV